MPRGFVYRTYVADDGVPFQLQVDADHAADPNRGWGATIPGADLLPRRFRPREVFGVSPTSGREASTRVGTTTCALWTGAATTFTVEATDGTIDTITRTGRKGERRRLAS